MSLPWLTAGAVVDSKRQGSGRDRGPTRQARGGEASGQPGSENFVMSAEMSLCCFSQTGGRCRRLLMEITA